VDLALVFKTPPAAPEADRLPEDQLLQLRALIRGAGVAVHEGPAAAKLAELRGLYEPFVHALARNFQFALPPVLPDKLGVDNWQTSAWTRRTPGIGKLPAPDGDDHFD
jgi:hypothetical protein